MKTKNIKETIKKYFIKNPNKKLRVREIERKLQLPLPSIIRYTKELEEETILTTINLGKATYYTANKNSEQYKLEKKLHNIKEIYESGLIEHLKQELSNPTIILFGSYAKGEDDEQSDIDIYVETLAEKIIQTKKYEKKLQRTIQLFRYKKIQDIKNPHLANNIINGITLNKQIQVFK